MDIELILEQEYLKLQNNVLSNGSKLNIISNIIQIKIENKHLKNLTNSLYKDLKQYIRLTIRVTDSADYLYDELQIDFLFELLKEIEIKPDVYMLFINIFRELVQDSIFNRFLNL